MLLLGGRPFRLFRPQSTTAVVVVYEQGAVLNKDAGGPVGPFRARESLFRPYTLFFRGVCQDRARALLGSEPGIFLILTGRVSSVRVGSDQEVFKLSQVVTRPEPTRPDPPGLTRPGK